MPKGGLAIDQAVVNAAASGNRVSIPTPGRVLRVRDTQGNWWSNFGPGNPLPAQMPQIAGRQFDFPVGTNLSYIPRSVEPISFPQLRSLADGFDLLRLIIETRKDQVEKQEWTVKKKLRPGETAKKTDNSDPRVLAIETFLRYPDRMTPWNTWLRAYLEDLFVIDAPTIYKRRTVGGQLLALDLVDGATIKPLIGEDGRQMFPPDPAYQQVIKGMPAVNYTMAELLYAPRNKRTNRFYGYSPVEQIVMTTNIAMRRQLMQLQYYTEGNVPEALIGVSEQWNPDQISAFQMWFDSLLSGNTAERRHIKFIPGSAAKNYFPTREPILKDEFDEWLARICCFAFSIPPTPFVRMMNRATAETALKEAKDEGMLPLLRYIKDRMDYIIAIDMGAPDLEFDWLLEEPISVLEQAQADDINVKNGSLSVDEAREQRGLDPIGMPHAIWGPTPPTLIDDVLNPPEPVVVTAPPGANPANGASAGTGAKGGGDSGGAKPGEVGKFAAAPFVKLATGRRALAPVSQKRRAVSRRAVKLKRTLAPLLANLGAVAGREVAAAYTAAGLAKDRKRSGAIADNMSMGKWAVLVDPVEEQLGGMADESAMSAIKLLGVSNDQITEQVHVDALDYAKERAAELVGMRYDDSGQLVENPNARWAITDSTREIVAAQVETAIEEGWSADRLATEIADGAAFDAARAEVVARTELALANANGAMIGYRDSGMVEGKVWLTAEDDLVSDDCQANADAGEIGLDENFPSGDDAPPAHPNCRCDVAPVVADES